METTDKSRTSPLVLGLLGAILVALIALTVVVALRWKLTGERGGGGGEHAKKPQVLPATVPAGETVTREKIKEQHTEPPKPSAPADTSRVAQSYKVGKTYRSLLKATVNARGSYKDWGVVTDSTFCYAAEAEVYRTVEKNDGTTLVLVQEFRRARNLSCFTKVEGVRFELTESAQTLLDYGGQLLSLPTGWTDVGLPVATACLNSPPILNALSRAATDSATKVFAYVDSVQGKKCRITYVNGTGVTSLEPIGCSFNGDEQQMVFATSFISDAYVFPDLQSKPGDTWTVHGEDLLPVLDPSLRLTMTGSLTARRGADGGTTGKPTAEIILDKGMLDLRQPDGSTETAARWAPRGKMTFSFADGIVQQAQLGGAFVMETRSTDHILFEMKMSIQPEYDISYTCEIVP